ncbi:MAG: hypothetical protein ACI9ZD_002515 [Paracoccaceae bacterium]|jgi:hypothetical protein
MKKQFIGFLVFMVAAVFSGALYAQAVFTIASVAGDVEKAFSLEEMLALDQV